MRTLISRAGPPPLTDPAPVAWALLRAFGPRDAEAPGRLDPGRAFEAAERFDLTVRIASRSGLARLAKELGAEEADSFRGRQIGTMATGLALEAAARAVARAALALDIPVAFLKGTALELAGVVTPGTRPACDVDVLTPERDAARLQAELLRTGFSASGSPAYEHQLPALCGANGAVIEIHTKVLGVRLDTKRSATFDTLHAAGLLRPVAGWPGCSVPTREVLAAHALVHGLAQHGAAPWAYAPMRVISDLVDLGLHAADGPALLSAIRPWVARDLDEASLSSAVLLCDALARGAYTDHELVRHAVAGLTDEEYRRRLKVLGAGSSPSDDAGPARAARALREALVLTRKQIDAIYGPPRSAWGYTARRILRPFDLAWRLALYAASAVSRPKA